MNSEVAHAIAVAAIFQLGRDTDVIQPFQPHKGKAIGVGMINNFGYAKHRTGELTH
jgi:hypothetical protein